MRSHARSWLAIGCVVVLILLLGVGAFTYSISGGVAVAVSGGSVTITNSGAPIRNARITVFEGAKSVTVAVANLPTGRITLPLPAPVGDRTYTGASINGSRYGVPSQWFFASTNALGGGPVANVSESTTEIPGTK